VRLPVDDGVLVMDPFNRGRPLDVDELRDRASPHLGGEAPDDSALAQILDPASHRAMLARMLRNLHGVYAEGGDWERAARSADRILRLTPDNTEALRDRGLAYLHMGHHHGARQDLERYLRKNPDAPTPRRCTRGWWTPAAPARARTSMRSCTRRAGAQTSIISKSSLVTPQSGQVQVSGTSSQRVPGRMPSSGRPFASS
jgi:tetratricopeptide (TPR) repeat protein